MTQFLNGFSTFRKINSGLFLTNTGSSVILKKEDHTRNQDWILNGSEIINRATNLVLRTPPCKLRD